MYIILAAVQIKHIFDRIFQSFFFFFSSLPRARSHSLFLSRLIVLVSDRRSQLLGYLGKKKKIKKNPTRSEYRLAHYESVLRA